MENSIIKFIRQKDYKFIKEIGQGGTGRTILLSDETINEQFVCKKYSPNNPNDKLLYFDNFVKEIKLLHLVYHKNIVRIFNYYLFPEHTTGYILMEFIEGQNISEFLKNNPEKLNDVFNQVIEGFKYLEENKILHRDIRPENILISDEGVVKIIDFGFGKQIQFETDNDKSVSLNWRYATPEEFTEKVYDSKTEIYFTGKLFEEIILENNLESFAYKTTLNKMIERSPLKRYGSFFDIERTIITDTEPKLTFTNKQKETYKTFAGSLSAALSNVSPDVQYISDIDQIISKLKDLYEKCLLEDFVQNTGSLIKCFIKGNFSYYTSKRVSLIHLKNFLDFFKNSPVDKQKIIINNLWGRIDSVPRREETPPVDVDDIPF